MSKTQSINSEVRSIHQAIAANHWGRVLRHAQIGRHVVALQFRRGESKEQPLEVTTKDRSFHSIFLIRGDKVVCKTTLSWGPKSKQLTGRGKSVAEAWAATFN